MKFSTKKRSAFILFALLMLMLFNAPILSVANNTSDALGIPVLFLYLFATWILCITLLFLFISFGSKGKSK